MNILLVNPPCGPRTIGMRRISRLEPLGLETIGAMVSRQHNVRLVDMLTCPADFLATLKVFTPDVVGVTAEAVRSGQALSGTKKGTRHFFDPATTSLPRAVSSERNTEVLRFAQDDN